MLRNQSDAAAYPRGDLQLVVCDRCGFISNRLFDEQQQGPLDEYEASQAFSPRFTRYMDELCERIISQYGVRGQRVLEIGCGSGDFVRRLCEAGDNRGWGFDPTCQPTGNGGVPSAGGVQLVREAYGERTFGRGADLIVCRHTLEHIPDVFTFMRMVRMACDAEGAPLVCFEVPDTQRILDEAAFWDVYYEHCSYFSSGSLRSLFTRSGFSIRELVKVYDEQYLLIFAEPGESALSPAPDDLARVLAGADRFADELRRLQDRWRSELARAAARGEAVVLWGAGSKAAGFLSTVGGQGIDHIVDINPRKQGMFQAGSGQEIISPERLVKVRPDTVILMNPIYRGEVEDRLAQMGLSPNLLTL